MKATLLMLLGLWLGLSPASAQGDLPRTALVMGVGDYGQLEQDEARRTKFRGTFVKNLPGITTSDLPQMEAKLISLGFSVTVVANPTLSEAKAAVDAFSARIKANPGVSLFYFSGHGGEAEGQNYLIPRRADIANKADLAQEALSAQRVLNGMEASGAEVNLVFLDCCREDVGKSVGGAELAPMKARGGFIGFATRSGDFADPEAQGSPYTRFLLKHMDTPGISFLDMYSKVVGDVKTYTKEVLGEERRPGSYSELDAPFYFAPVVARVAPIPPPIPPPAPGPSEPPTDSYSLMAGKVAGGRKLIEVAAGVRVAFRWCPAGRFTMGSPASEKAVLKAAGVEASVYSMEVEHEVTLTKGYWLAETEVTQGQWQGVMKTSLVQQANEMLADETVYKSIGGQKLRDKVYRKKGEGSKTIAVEEEKIAMYYVNWQEAEEFCSKASRHAGVRGWRVSLPTEAQWEYACRAGTTGMTYAGNFTIKGENNAPGLDPVAWYGGNSSEGYSGRGWSTVSIREMQYPGETAGIRKVGAKQANAWGLHDMLGNLWEWCADWHEVYPALNVSDPEGPPATGTYRVNRGSSWGNKATHCRAAIRGSGEPGIRAFSLGFRPALVLSVAPSSEPPVEPPPVDSSLDQPGIGKPMVFTLPEGEKLTMQSIPAGSFTMGSPGTEDQRTDDESQVEVTLTQNYWLGKTEFTQGQWKAVMGSNPSIYKGDDLPVETVGWDDVQQCLVKMQTTVPPPKGWRWSLPTEAQWEYACRAGTVTAFSFGPKLSSEEANFDGDNSVGVASYGPNGWGLYDMHGNVREWCEDAYTQLRGGTDPLAEDGAYRVFRGGSWSDEAEGCRAAKRRLYGPGPDFRAPHLGFRPALVPSS